MVYCQKCGRKNDEDAQFCDKCGASLVSPRRPHYRHSNDKCEEDCSDKRHPKEWSNFWMVILALVAVGIVFSIIMRVFRTDLPEWIRNFEFWDIFGLLIGLVIVVFIIYMISHSRQKE